MSGGYSCVKMGLQLIDQSRHQTRVAQMLQTEIERLRSMAWADLVAMSNSPTVVAISAEFSPADNGNYYMTRALTGSGESRKITLSMTWSDSRGQTKSKTYVTQYTQGGLYDYIQ